MHFSLEAIPARKGDCLLLHFGDAGDARIALIDGGPSQVFGPNLSPRLDEMRAALAIADDDPLPLALLMVSHIDDDHIRGILEMSAELAAAKTNREPQRVRVRSFWHNTFDDLVSSMPDQLGEANAGFGLAGLAGRPEAFEGLESAMVLASVAQGARLRDDAKKLGWKNAEFGKNLVMATDAPEVKRIDDLELTVVGPLQPELVKLQQAHDEWVREQRRKKGSAAEAALAAYVDQSVANLSSIVALARKGGKSILLTGDARGDRILEGLKLTRLMRPAGTLHVDILKAPHHGSANNVEPEFFATVTADHYVFSGDGEHGNPERETLEMLLEARPDDEFHLHFTYPIAEIDAEREKDWEKQQAKERRRGGHVRADWSARKNALGPLLKKLPAKQKVFAAEGPQLIELADPVEY